MRGENESLHHGVSHKPGRPDFWKNKTDLPGLWKNKTDHKKKHETQEQVSHGRNN